MPGLNACFVNVGHERDAFLHYLDLGIHYRSFEKYLQLIQDGKKGNLPLTKASGQSDLEKRRKYTEHTKARSRSTCTNS